MLFSTTGLINYCFCLCFGLEQITRKCLARFTILQLSHIFFTVDLTRIKIKTETDYAKTRQKQGKDPYFSMFITF